MKVAQYIMGHSNINITMNVYTHVADEKLLRSEMRKLDQTI